MTPLNRNEVTGLGTAEREEEDAVFSNSNHQEHWDGGSLTSPAQRAGSIGQLSAPAQHLGAVESTRDQVGEDKLTGL